MSKLVSVQQAAANALAAHIKKQLNDPNLVIEPRWPDPRRLPQKAITVIFAGPRIMEYHEQIPYLAVPQPSGLPLNTVMWRWVVGNVEQPIQLDVWCLDDLDRDALVAGLDIVLHQGPGVSLGNGGSPIDSSLLVALAASDGWPGATAEAAFDEGPELTDTPISVAETMYRARWKGTLQTVLTVDAPSPQIALIEFKIRMSEAGIPQTSATPGYAYDLTMSVSGTRPAQFSGPTR